MSGAFNIDIEVGPGNAASQIRIYCASLTDTWVIERKSEELEAFHKALISEETVVKNKIFIPNCPKVNNANDCELFLSQLGCNAAVLRIKTFHDFLQIPEQVRNGLTYASHKPFGKSLRDGYLQKHPRYVRRGGGKRYVRLTQDERGGSLICYKDENSSNQVIASLKIGASTEIKNLSNDGIPNAFVLKSGKRQWILQAQSSRDHTLWQSQLVTMLKQFGSVNLNTTASTDEKKDDTNTNNNNNNNDPNAANNNNNNNNDPNTSNDNQSIALSKSDESKIIKQNLELKTRLDEALAKIDGMSEEISRLKEAAIEAGSNTEEMRRKIRKEFEKQTEEIERDYELQHENLRAEIEELHRKLEAKTAMEGGHSGLKNLFGDGFKLAAMEDELKSEIDSEKKLLDSFSAEERATIKFIHKHLHRHDHKHIHHHRHVHIHDSTKDPSVTMVSTHTISHTITHTNTQFKIKKSFF